MTHKSPRAPHNTSLKIAEDLRKRIMNGSLRGRIPTQSSLAVRYGASKRTVQNSIRILRAEGLVVSDGGAGTFTTANGDRRLPILEQVTALLRSGRYAPGDPFSTALALCTRLHASSNAVCQALVQLEQQGYIARAARGRIVVALPPDGGSA